METITEKIARLKLKAELFLKEDIKAFIRDVYDNYYFCNIVLINEDWLYVQFFKGQRQGERLRIFWVDILEISEYREETQIKEDFSNGN
jgi:hypothetical protein